MTCIYCFRPVVEDYQGGYCILPGDDEKLDYAHMECFEMFEGAILVVG